MKKSDITILIVLLLAPVLLVYFQLTTVQSKSSGTKSIFNTFTRKIGVIDVEGVIYSSKQFNSELKSFEEDKMISGVIIRVNSPGGAVAPSQEMYQAIRRFKRNSSKPVYISMGTVAASGGYYIASAGDRIFANSGTLTGSIGVIMQFSHYHELLKKLGVQVSTITAGTMKDAGSPYRDITAKEKKYFDALLEDNHKQFISDIAVARDMNADSLVQYAQGQIFSGNMALENGLIDTIGTFDDCSAALKSELGLPQNTPVVKATLPENSNWTKLLESKLSFAKSFVQILPRSGTYYLATELQ